MSTAQAKVRAPRRHRRLLWNTAGVAVALAGVVAMLALWAGSPQAERLVRRRLAAQLQNMTGGRVEIGSFHWRLMKLEMQADGVVIHGDEGPAEAPYARIESVRAQVSVLGEFSPRIELRQLEIDQPQIHLIFYRDGATNQPHPARPAASSPSGLDTLFRLHVNQLVVKNGVIDLDNRAAYLDFQNRYEPLDFRADDVSTAMAHVPASAHAPEAYRVDVSADDLNLTRGGSLAGKVPPVHGVIKATLDLSRDAVNLRSLTMTASVPGAADRTLRITGWLQHFSRPHWQAAVAGDLDMRLLNPVLGYPDAPEGLALLKLDCGGLGEQFHVDGTVRVEKGSYVVPGVTARNVDLNANVHADPDTLRITSIDAKLAPGESIGGEVLLDHWIPPTPRLVLEPVPAEIRARGPSSRNKKSAAERAEIMAREPAPAPHSALLKQVIPTIPVNGRVHAEFHNVTLDTVLAIVGQPPFKHLGIDTVLNGPADANWTRGDVGTLSVAGRFGLSPSGRSIRGESPANGAIDATYRQKDGGVDVRTLDLNLPASQLTAHGHLGAYPLTSPTGLTVDIHSGDLSEFDTVLRDLGLARNGRSGVAALPVTLSGQAAFQGSWTGSLLAPHLVGTLKANEVGVELPAMFNDKSGQSRFLHFDSISADGAYSPSRIAIEHGQLRNGGGELLIDGSLSASQVPAPGRIAAAHPATQPVFDANSTLHLRLRASNLSAAEALDLANANVPVTGLLDAQIAADGPLNALNGSGWVQLSNAVMGGQPVTSLRAQGTVNGPTVKLTSIALRSPAGAITGSGEYDLHQKRFQLEANAGGIDVSRIEPVQASGIDVSGKLSLHLTASGTPAQPKIDATAGVAGFAVAGEPMGNLQATAHTTANRTLEYQVATAVDAAKLSMRGQTELRGDYPTEATIDVAQFDVATLFRLAHLENIGAQSALSGAAVVSGPLQHPLEMRGDLRLQQMALTIAGVHLKSDGGVHAALDNARISLDPLHITGEDTDMRISGGLSLRDTQQMDFAASGAVNLKLAQTLDPDLTANGTTTFQVEAHGPWRDPALRGRIEFQNGSLSLEDVPNGLSQLHGVLEFNRNRLEVRSLTAMTGGGLLSVGGYLSYQHGIYADLTVTGKSVRIRYPEGVSSEADTTLQLTGTQSSLLLSGNVLVTHFTVSPDFDIAALAAQAAAVQPVAPPNAPSNHVRLDVRIRSSPQLNFQNAYAKLAGDVDLRLRGTVASPSLLGRVSITEGSATIAGTRYDLQRGDITFTNPVRIQPSIDLTATARVEDYDITLGVHGTPGNPLSVTYRSDPPLPEADVVALLALGRTQSEQGLYTEQQQQSVSLAPSTDVLLGGALNATVSSRVQKLFGAGSVKVDPSYLGALGNSTTRITVEEQVGPNVTLTYATNVDTTAQQLIQAEIAVNRHVSLLVARDESGVFSMVIKATRRYK